MMNKESWKYKLPWIPLFFSSSFFNADEKVSLICGDEKQFKRLRSGLEDFFSVQFQPKGHKTLASFDFSIKNIPQSHLPLERGGGC